MWLKASKCVGQSHCVEVMYTGESVMIRNNKEPNKVIEMTREEWAEFVDFVRIL